MCSVPDPPKIDPQIKVDRNAQQSARVKLKRRKKPGDVNKGSGLKQLQAQGGFPTSISELLGGLTIGSRS